MPLTQKHRTLAIGTPLGEDALVLRTLSTVEALGRPFEYQLELGSEKADIAFKDILGQNVTIRLELPGGGTRYFNGFVSRFSHAGQRGRVFHYHATVVPWLWLLSRASDCRIFQEMTAPEIIRKVFRDRGFSDFRENLSASYRKWEYCVQYRETDFNFVSRLMEQEGIYYYFEHENGKHTLVLCDSVSAHKPFAGYESVNFRPFDDGVHKKDFIYEWRVEETLQPGVYELNDFDFKKPRKGLATRAAQPGPHANSDLPIYDYPGEYTEFGDGQQYAQVRLQGLHAQYHLYHGQANARGLCAGSTFKLAEFPVAALNKEYLITQVAYTVRGDPFEADDASAGGAFCGVRFSALPSTTPFRTTPSTPKPIVQGPQTALVVGKAGEEIWTDPHGRVKVKFHWDRYAKADENSSCWIRVSQNWASKKWGTFFLPRIGQEVIVEFLEGDPDRPIVTGCVYNGDAPTPYDLPKEATKSTIKTNTSKGGDGFNEIRFEDKKGKEQIFIHGQRDLDVRIRDDIRETNYGDRDIRVGKVDGPKGMLNTLVRKDANTHIMGGQFEQIDKQLNQTVKEDVVEDYQKNQTTFVKDKYQLNAKEIVVEGGQVISHKSGKITIQGAQGVHIKGMSVAIEGSTGVSLKVGGNFVSVNPAGVAIKGSMVMINSGGSPLSAEAAKAVVAPEIQAPFEARRADDGKTGSAPKVSASPISMLKRLLKLNPAPAFIPFTAPAKPGEKIEPPAPATAPKKSPEKPCDIAKLSVCCAHKAGKRLAIDQEVLQIVPTDSQQTKGYEAKFFEVLSVSGTTKSGGEDRLDITVTSKDGQAGGRKQVCLKRSPNAPSDSEWIAAQKRSEVIKAIPRRGLWLASASPDEYFVFGRGCVDGNMHSVHVQVFPSENYDFSISLDAKVPYYRRWNELLEVFNAAQFGPIKVVQKMTPPSGKIGVKLGWQERDNWRVAYECEVSAAADPCWGGSLVGSVSLLQLAASAGGPLTAILGKWISRRVDGTISVTVGISSSITGAVKGRKYPDKGWEVAECTFEVAGKGSFGVAIEVKANVWVTELKLEGKATTEMVLAGQASLSDEGLKAKITFTFGEIKAAVGVVTSAYEEDEPVEKATGARVWEIRKKEEIELGEWVIVSPSADQKQTA